MTTPNVLTEVANLHDQGFSPPLRDSLHHSLYKLIGDFVEIFEPAKAIVKDPAISRLGLTDTGLLMSLDLDHVLLTIDGPLFREAIARNLKAVNFHHLREDEGLA